jgi:hypothetical protein
MFWVCICTLRYLACNARVPYCHLWPARLHEIFPLYLINGTIFKKKKRLLNIKSVFFFFRTLVINISHSKKNWARHDQNCTLTFMQIIPNSCPKLMKLKFSRKIIEEYSNAKFYENLFNESRVPCGMTHTHRRTDMTKLVVAFRNFAYASKIRTTQAEIYASFLSLATTLHRVHMVHLSPDV